MSTFGGKITDILIRRKCIDKETLAEAEDIAKQNGDRLEHYLVSNNYVEGAQMALTLAEYLNMPPISLAHFSPDPNILSLIPKETLKKYGVIPVARVGKHMTLALGDPFDIIALDEIQSLTGLEVTPLVAPEKDIKDALDKIFAEASQGLDMEELMRDEGDIEVDKDNEEDESLDTMLEGAEGAPVIRMVNMILLEAIRRKASDIHIEAMEKYIRLRYRIDGQLIETPAPPKNLQSAVISRIKILSDLDIAERRVPQDGRFKIRALGKEVDLRVSILPTVHGEKIVMRTLDKSNLAPSLAALGLNPKDYNDFCYAIKQPHGIILVTGPTGSGKTTTLYSCLQDMNDIGVNIITCEDPVEYQLDGINQVQIHAAVGLTFAAALRSILRQDPDICLVGEIRDSETAEIAVKAALTGHLVLSTLHTNDAPGAVTRMVDMGIEPFLLGSSLVLAQAQRLFRKLCPVCKKESTIIDADVLKNNGIPADFFEGETIYEAVGCPKCGGAGYKGRGCIMEILLVNEAIREVIIRGGGTAEIRKMGVEAGMTTLQMTGLQRVKEGVTSLEAAIAVTGGGH
jgi:type IV pilus assembly protein PilB